MPTTIQVEIPDIILERYSSPASLESSIYQDIILSEFQKGHLSVRESAKLLHVSYEGFIELLGSEKMSFINASPDELKQSYADFESFLQTYQP